jgi:hypothetical protein
MPPKRIHVVLTPAQIKALDGLTKKLHLDRTNIIRLAIARLAEAEQVKS